MTRDARHIAIVAVLAILVALLGGVAGWCMRGNMRGENNRQQPPPDTIRIHTTDTLRIASVPDTVTNTVTRYVSVPVYIRDTDTIREPVTVPLPFEQHFARIGEVADVWFSGFQVRIDSAVSYYHHTTEIIRQPYEVPKMPRLTAGVGCGAFYTEKRANAYLFGEMRYNAPKTTFGTFAAIDPTGQWCAGATVTYRLDIIH